MGPVCIELGSKFPSHTSKSDVVRRRAFLFPFIRAFLLQQEAHCSDPANCNFPLLSPVRCVLLPLPVTFCIFALICTTSVGHMTS